MNKDFTKFIRILVSLLSLAYSQCKTCPSLTTNYLPMFDYGYYVRSFLKIPSTNVLIINTRIKNIYEDSSIVYYSDMVSIAGEIINVIRSEYVIIEMSYMYQQDKILVMNYERIISANPYTLKSEKSISLKSLVHAQMIDKTKYAIATLRNYSINIIDTDLMVIITTLDNSRFPNVLNTYNYYTKYFSRSNPSQYLLITVNSYGFYSWSLDLDNFGAKYNGYIGPTIVNNTIYASRQFTKHPSQDIFFVGGANYEILAFEIVDINTQTYRTQMKLNLYDSKYLFNITNIVYKISQNTAMLIVGDGYYIYDLVLNFSQANKITIPTYLKPPYYYDLYYTNYTWYEIPEYSDQRMILALNNSITVYNYINHTFTSNLYFGTDMQSRKFMYEGNGVAYQIVLRDWYVQYFDRSNLVKSLFPDYNIRKPLYEVNNFYSVKNCAECFIFKSSESSISNYIQQIIAYPLNNSLSSSMNISSIGFYWNQVNLNLDPFSYKNQTWVVFGFKNKTSDKKYLFTLINMHNKTQNVNLTGATDEENNRQSSYAISSVDDPKNLEIIGVDLLGYIYVWDFLSPLQIKYSRKTNYSCLNSDIGTIYQYNQKKWLILACDDMKILSHDFEKNTTSLIRLVATNPLSLRAFPRLGIIAIGDTIIGNAYIYKFNNGIFTYFLTIQSGYSKDRILSIELLKDNTIWVQYYYSNLLYSLGDCIDDVKDCQNCQQTHYFNTNYFFDDQKTYGIGTQERPYTSSQSFLTAMLKAQRYQDRISGTTNMNVNIFVDPLYKMNIPKEYLKFDFSSIIQLTIKSKIQSQIALLEYGDVLEFSDYSYVGLQDIRIQYYFTKQPNECGINFYNIAQNATLNNIQLYAKDPIYKTLNCFQISADQTNLKIMEFSIKNQDFSSHTYIFSTLFVDWIDIQNLSLENCILGDQFSILVQKSNLIASMKSISIINNKCTENRTGEVSSLFSAGQISIEDLQIKNNNFCNKIIFSSVPLLSQQNYQFEFKQVQVSDNSFMTKTTYLFFNSLYSMKNEPSHSVTFLKVTFQNNMLQRNNKNDLMKLSFIQTSKISNHKFEDIIFKNHHEISFASIEYSNKVQITNFQCINDKEYLDQSPNSDSGSCLQLYEILSTQIQTIRINYKKAYNNELINLQNTLYNDKSDFDIKDGQFSNMILMQQSINALANPITIIGQNYLDLTFSNCHFINNNLEVTEDSQTFSTSALYILDSLGIVNIIDSTFKNSTSNSIYNFIFIESSQLQLHNLTFDSSSFGLDTSKHLGGFMHLILKTLKIFDSSFSKSKSSYGSFIYMESFGKLFKIDITNTVFSEGYAEVDGGALFIDLRKSQLIFTCIDCFFNDIYVYSSGSSAIGFQKYRITTQSVSHNMIFQDGHIKNIFGVKDNFFADIDNMKLSFIDIKEIKSLISESEEFQLSKRQQFGKTASQQSTLVGSQYSEINLQGCNINDFQVLNQDSNLPLLIRSEFTSVSFTDTQIQDGIFVRNAIQVINGTLSLKNTQFINITQSKQLLQRQLSVESQSSNNTISSLIVMMDSNLMVSEGTSFNGIKCYRNCTGAVFHLENTNFLISEMIIFDSEASYGGSLFIQGLKLQNEIISSQFVNNKAQIDGGAIYLQALKDDSFSFKILNCKVLQNNAESGQGGALFIRSNNQNSTNQLIEILDTVVSRNIAQIGGGIYQKEISPIILGSTVFQENVGKIFGNDVLSYPTHLRLVSMNQFLSLFKAENIGNNTIAISNFRSGNTLSDLSFELVNDQDEVIGPLTVQELQDFSVNVQVSKNQNFQNYSIRGNVSTHFDSKSKKFIFQNFDFIGIPGQQATLEFVSNQIYILDKNKVNQYYQNYSFNIIINFRECIQGEIILEYNQLTECKVCQAERYSFDLSECYTCPTGATCPGGAEIIVDQGYWRKTNESTEVISCSLEENCKGGSHGNDICFEGHIGALCEECDITGVYWKDNYAKYKKKSCTKCDLIVYNSWFVFLVTLWTLASMALAIKGDIKDQFQSGIFQHVFNLRKNTRENSASISQSQVNQQNNSDMTKNISRKNSQNKELINSSHFNYDLQKNQNRIRNLSKFGEKVTSKNNVPIYKQKIKNSQDTERSGIYIKILTNYFQIVSSVATFNLKIPSGIFEFPQLVGQPLEQTLNSLDCILKDYYTSIPFIYLRLIFSFLIPVGYFIIFLTCLALIWFYKRKSRFPWYILSSAAMFLIIYCQPDLVSQMISLMSCRKIGDTKYILANVSYECYTSTHSKYVLLLIGPLLTAWVLVIPFILFSMLYRNRENLNKIKIKLRYGLLYKEYKKEAFYWEFVKMVEKICIILCLNFYYTDITIKALLVFSIIVIYGILCIIVEPFEENNINSLDIFSTNVCALTVLLGIFIYQNPYAYFYYSCLGIMIALNCLFTLTVLKRIINIYFKRLEKIIQNNFRNIAIKIPSFRKYLQQEKKKKIVDPIVKERVKKILENYISMSFEEKQKIKIRILKSQFNISLSNMFGDYEDSKDSFRNVKYRETQHVRKRFNLDLNYGEEQNYLISQGQQKFSPLLVPLYTLGTHINSDANEDEENQQRRALARLLVESEIKCEDEIINKPLVKEQCDDIQAEEIKRNWSSSLFYQSKEMKFLDTLNNQTPDGHKNKVLGEQNNDLITDYENFSPLHLLHSESGQTLTNNSDEDNQQKRAMSKFSKLEDYKSQNKANPQSEKQEQCDFNIEETKVDLESRDNYQSQEIKLLHSINNQLFGNQDEIKEKEKNEQSGESQIGESKVQDQIVKWSDSQIEEA